MGSWQVSPTDTVGSERCGTSRRFGGARDRGSGRRGMTLFHPLSIPIDSSFKLSDYESGEESYFADPLNSRFPVPRPADERGYVVRRNVMEESTRPDYVIPVGSADGVWSMMKQLGQFRGEGWLALWKGPYLDMPLI